MNFVEFVAYSELALKNNAAIIEYCRTSMAALSGATAGMLDLTSLYGFGFFLFSSFVLWVNIVHIFFSKFNKGFAIAIKMLLNYCIKRVRFQNFQL